MKKRILAMLLAGVMTLGLAACSGGTADTKAPSTQPVEGGDTTTGDAPAGRTPIAKEDLKIGMIMIGEENDNGYNYNHVVGMQEMQEALGIADDQIVYKTNIGEDASCSTAIEECIEAGCQIIFCNSFGHEAFMSPIAAEHPEIEFCHATGYQAAGTENTNDHNYFTKIFEARYLAGIAAGMKAKEIGNPKLGYVGAFPFAEVISGFTAFYLGAKSVYPEVTMDVMYTNSWSDATVEAQVAKALIDGGCGVISQHSDTTAPATTAEANGAFQVGYNADMIAAAPNASLVSARVDWGVYYTFAIQSMIDGTAIPDDWCRGFADGAVYLSPLNETIIAEGTKEAIEAAEQQLKDGFHVFSGALHGVDVNTGEEWTQAADGFFDESGAQSAPSFSYIIDGINNIMQ